MNGEEFGFSLTNIRDEVYLYLRKQILENQFPPGYRFDLNALGTKLGISRTPLKEALQRLEVEGLVEIRARRGTFVNNIVPKEVHENFQVRRALEIYVARYCLEDASPERIEEIIGINDAMRALLKGKTFDDLIQPYIALDRKFHDRIIALSPNQRLRQIYEEVNIHIQIVKVYQFYTIENVREAQLEHDAIQEAFNLADGLSLAKALDAHIEKAIVRLMAALSLKHSSEGRQHSP